MMVMISTVGYGDINVNTMAGRVAVMVVIINAMVMVPRQTNELLEMIMTSSRFLRAKYNAPRSRRAQHIVICGNVGSSGVIELFTELFHQDHDAADLHAVVLQPEPPCYEMQVMLRHKLYKLHLTYLEGSPFVERDLRRARVQKAVAVLLFTNKFSMNHDVEDSKIILQQ